MTALPLLKVDDPTVQFNFDRVADLIRGSGIPRIVSGGAADISTSQSTTSTSYTTLTTPDTVTITLPTKGLVAVWYRALAQNTIASNGKAAIFIGANQLKTAPATGGAGGVPIVQEASLNNTINVDAFISTFAAGLAAATATAAESEVTTGLTITRDNSSVGGPCYFDAAAGTYDISIKFKNTAAGTLTVKNRHLWVAAYAFN